MNEKELKERVEKYIKSFNGNALDCIAIGTVLTLLKKKDKLIDLMAEQLAGLTIFDIDKDEPLILEDKEEVKQYFERKVNRSKQK